ncbi:MAG: SNF2-related protein, partial [Actinomycetota bacterium]|nr:SNF2-related protein [Actinomycetota bacterium]
RMAGERPEGFEEYWSRVGWKGTWTASDPRVQGFYVPMLARSCRYDRMAGYFTSTALSMAGAGLSHFIRNGGRMRLIVGAKLDDDDVASITEGRTLFDTVEERLSTSDVFDEVEHVIALHRRAVLAWLTRTGRLEIKVGVPLDRGVPLRPEQTDRYFHSKYGIFTDCTDEAARVAFIGSDNETAQGWVHNHETFSAFASWRVQTWADNGIGLVDLFEAHWEHRPDEGWAVFDLPTAVRDRLVELAPEFEPPEVEPIVEAETPSPPPMLSEPDPRLVELSLAPRRDGGSYVGLVTAAIEPLPHQTSLVQRVVDSWPRGYLLADEVGLGKTIEAGFIIRELLLSGRAETFLLLVPAAVLRQWQEELSEKLNLRVNRFEDGHFVDPDNRPVTHSGSPWNAFPIVLASSHLARRRDRQRELLSSGPWDVVLLDEAHHARRKGAKLNDPPNQLLSLLWSLRAQNAFRTLLLASATPMQMYPREAWDLVQLFGLPGRWGQSAASFIRYFEELKESFPDRDWTFLSEMARDSASDPEIAVSTSVRQRLTALGPVSEQRVADAATKGITAAAARGLPEKDQKALDLWLIESNPVRDRVFRNTRETLRRYQAAGLLPADVVIPRRQVSDCFLDMSEEEFKLYERIRQYIKSTYNRFTLGAREQQALGFIMTVYRRRLTSSFKAIELSLARRLDALVGRRAASELLDEDDREADPTLFNLDLKLSVVELEGEIAELGRFIDDLRALPPDETKMRHLEQLLEDAFTSGGHDTALVFTQYADTMNHIVEQLRVQYGPRVMSYSGEGGVRLDPATGELVRVSKKETKRLFREGEKIKILVGTDSLSEGLNLQTCGRVVNFDMPWNFMRVEQRIGRVDRIGGRELVEVSNLFYNKTIEEQVYRGVAESHGGFTWIVGPAQPVLADLERRIIEHELGPEGLDEDGEASLLGPPPGSFEEIVEDILREVDEAEQQPVTLASFDTLDPDEMGARLR